jgi:hypothetical protein
MERGIVPPCITMEALAPQARTACRGPHLSRGRGGGGELVRGGDLSCDVETCRRGSLLWGTGRRCCQLVGSMMCCQCGS